MSNSDSSSPDRDSQPETAYRVTTDHAASSYGQPVLVAPNGTAYGPGDTLPDGRPAAEVIGQLQAAD